jgi:hypothetical protein
VRQRSGAFKVAFHPRKIAMQRLAFGAGEVGLVHGLPCAPNGVPHRDPVAIPNAGLHVESQIETDHQRPSGAERTEALEQSPRLSGSWQLSFGYEHLGGGHRVTPFDLAR